MTIYKFNGFELNSDSRELMHSGRQVEIQNKSLELLIYLIRNHDRAISKDELLDKLWDGRVVSESVLSHSATKLRAALKSSDQSAKIIRTVYGFGFQFTGELESLPQADAPDSEHSVGFLKRYTATAILSLLVIGLIWIYSFRNEHPSATPSHEKVYFLTNTNSDDWLVNGLSLYFNQVLAYSNQSVPIPIQAQLEHNTQMQGFFSVKNTVSASSGAEHIELKSHAGNESVKISSKDLGKSIQLISEWACDQLIENNQNCEQDLKDITSDDAYVLESYFRGVSALKSSEPQKAIQYLEASIQHDNKLTFARLALAEAHLELSNHTLALTQLEAVLSLTQNKTIYYDALLLKAKTQLRMEKHDAANSALQSVIESNESLPIQKAQAGLSMANLLMNSDDLSQAFEAAENSLSLFQEWDIPLYTGETYEIMGTIKMTMGELVEAQQHLTRSLKIFERLEYDSGTERVLSPLGLVHQSQGQLQPSLIYGEQRLEITKKMGNPIGIAGAHLHLANLLLEMGDFEKAMSHADQMWEIVINEDEPQALLLAYFIAGEIARADGKLRLSMEKYQKAYEIANEYKIPFRQVQIACTLGATAIDAELWEQAESYLASCQQFAKEQKDQLFTAVAHLYTAQLLARQDKLGQSQVQLQLALEQAQPMENNHLLYEIHLEFFFQYLDSDLNKAEQHLLEIPEDYRDSKDYLLSLAQLRLQQQEFTAALDAALQAKQMGKDNWSNEDQLLLQNIQSKLSE